MYTVTNDNHTPPGSPTKLITPSHFAAPAKSETLSPTTFPVAMPALSSHNESSIISPSGTSLTSVSELNSQLLDSETSTLVSDTSEQKEAREHEGAFEFSVRTLQSLEEFQKPVGKPLSSKAEESVLESRQTPQEGDGEEGEETEEGKENGGSEVKKKELSDSSHNSARFPEHQALANMLELLKTDSSQVASPPEPEKTSLVKKSYEEFTQMLLDPEKQKQLLTSTEKSEFDTNKSELVSLSNTEHLHDQGGSEITMTGGAPPSDYLKLLRQMSPPAENEHAEPSEKKSERKESPWPDIRPAPPPLILSGSEVPALVPVVSAGEVGGPTSATGDAAVESAEKNQQDEPPPLTTVETHESEPAGTEGNLPEGAQTIGVSPGQSVTTKPTPASALAEGETKTEEEEEEEEGQGEEDEEAEQELIGQWTCTCMCSVILRVYDVLGKC